MAHEFFQSGDQNPVEPLEVRIRSAIKELSAGVGLGERDEIVAWGVKRELERIVAKNVLQSLLDAQIRLEGAHVLELGAGLGALSVEAATLGAHVVAVEPGAESCRIAGERLAAVGGKALCVSGESLPFPDGYFDLVLSHQVLEHVETPINYLREAHRVLKPGGHLYLACENYMSFWEPHYQVPWLPLLPKWIGRIYLRLLGRPTSFLDKSITYTTVPWVLRMLRQCGFRSLRELKLREKIWQKGRLWQWACRICGRDRTCCWVVWTLYMMRTFRRGIYVLEVKV